MMSIIRQFGNLEVKIVIMTDLRRIIYNNTIIIILIYITIHLANNVLVTYLES